MKFFSVFLLCVLACNAKDCPSKKINSKLLCYYSKLKDIDNCYCTHVILPADADLKSIENLRQKLNGVKILLTVNEFHQGLIDTVKENKIDGLELNLKKLDSKNDITEFINTVRTRLGNDLYLALSVPPRMELLVKYYDMKALTKTTDLFILQTAFLGASKNVTFHPSRLSGMWDMQNTDSVVDLVTGLGAPLSRLAITAPVQAFKFTLQDKSLSTPGSPALELTTMTRTELCEKMSNGDNWTLERDQDQAGPYIFREKEWISYEDATSMDIKAKYSRVRGLAGLALKDLSMDEASSKCGSSLLEAAHTGLSKQNRAPRAVVLKSLEREILETQARPLRSVNVSPYRISRVIDVEGHVHVIRQDTRTEFECSRQGYFVHPHSCGRFYRCVKFDQQSEEFSVFEFDCPAGLAFDARVEVCVWPGSLPDGAPCSGSSEIAPVPKERFGCPSTPGYYADPENCRWFFACLDHGKSGLTAYEFRCPFGLVFDEKRLLCEWPWLVPTCGNGYHTGLELDSVDFFGGSAKSTLVQGQQQTGLSLQSNLHGLGAHVLESYDGLGSLGNIALGGYQGDLNTLKQGFVLGYDNSGNLAHSNLGAGLLNPRYKISGNTAQGSEQLSGGAEFGNNGQATSQLYGNTDSQANLEYQRNSGQSNLEHQGNFGLSDSQFSENIRQYQDNSASSVIHGNSGFGSNGQSSSEYLGNSDQSVNYHGNAEFGNNGESNLEYQVNAEQSERQGGNSAKSTVVYHGNSGFGSKSNTEYQVNSKEASVEYQGNEQNIAFVDSGLRKDSGRNIAFSNIEHGIGGYLESGSLIAENGGYEFGAQNSEALNQENAKLATGTLFTSNANAATGLNLRETSSGSSVEYHGNNGQSREHITLLNSGAALNSETNIDGSNQYNGNSNFNNENSQDKLSVIHFGTNYGHADGQVSHEFNSGLKLEQANIGLINLGTNSEEKNVHYYGNEQNGAYNSEPNKHNIGATSSQSIVTHHQGHNDKLIVAKTAYQPEQKTVLLNTGINTGDNLYSNEGASFNLQSNSGLHYSNLDQNGKIATSTVHLNSGYSNGKQILVDSGLNTGYEQYGNIGAKSSASVNLQKTVLLNSGVNQVNTGATSNQYYGGNAENLQFDSVKYQSVPIVQHKVEYPTLVQHYEQINSGNLNYNYQYANEAKYNVHPVVSHVSTSHVNVGSFDKYNGDAVISHIPKLNYNIQVPTSITYDSKLTHGLSSDDISVHGANIYSERVASRPVNSESIRKGYNYATNYISVTPKTDIFKLPHKQTSYLYQTPAVQYQQNIQTIPYEQTQQQNIYKDNSGAKSYSSFVQHHTTAEKVPSIVLSKVEAPTIQYQQNVPYEPTQFVQQPIVQKNIYNANSGAKSHSSFAQHHTTAVKTPSVVLSKVEVPTIQYQQNVPYEQTQYVQQPIVQQNVYKDNSGTKSHSSFVQHHTTEIKSPSVVLSKVEAPSIQYQQNVPYEQTQYVQQHEIKSPVVQQNVVYEQAANSGAQSHSSFVQHHSTAIKTPSVFLTKVESLVTPKYETHYVQQQVNIPVIQEQQQIVTSKVNSGAKSHASFVQTPVETVSVTPNYETHLYQQQQQQREQQVQHQHINYNAPVIQQATGFAVSSTPKYETHYQKQIVPIVQQQVVLSKVEQQPTLYQGHTNSGAQSHSSFVQHHTTNIKTPTVLTKMETPIHTISVTPQYEPQYYGKRVEQVQPIQYQDKVVHTPIYSQAEIKSTSYNIQQPIQYETYSQPKVQVYAKQIHRESVSASPTYGTYSYSPPKQQIKYESRDYLPPRPAVSTVYISSTPKYVAPQVYVSTTPKYAVFQEFVQPKQTFEIKKTVVPVTPTYQTYSVPKYESTFYGTHETATAAPRIVESYNYAAPKQVVSNLNYESREYLPPKQVVTNSKYESRDYLPPKPAVSTVYESSPKDLPAKTPEVYVSTTPKYAVFQEYIQPKQTYEIKKTVRPTVINQNQYENTAFQNYESNLNYKQDYAYVALKEPTETVYYQTQKPYISSTYRPVQVKNYQTQYIISTPRPTFASTIAPIIKQTPRVRTKVVALTKFETFDNKYYVSTPKPIYFSTSEPIITKTLTQQLPTFNYYDSRFDTGSQKTYNEHVTPKAYVVKQETVTTTPEREESYSNLPQKLEYYDSRFDTSTQKQLAVEKEFVKTKAYETFSQYETPRSYIQETVTAAPKIVESYSYQPSKQIKYEPREYLPPKIKTIYISTTPKPYLPPKDKTYLEELPEFKYYDSRLDTASQKSEQYYKETSANTDQFGNYEFVSEPVPTRRPAQRKKIVLTTTSGPIESYSRYDDTFDSQYIISTPRPKVIRPVLRKKIVTTTVIPLEVYEPVITTLRPKLIRPIVKKKKIVTTTQDPYYENYEASSIEPEYETIITPKPKSKIIVRVNDFHPFLTTKLAAQCTCTSNTLKLTQKSKPKDAFDFNYNLPDNVPVTKYNGDGLASYDNYEQPGVYAVDSSEGSDDYNYDAQKIVAVTQTPKVLIKSTTNAAQPAPTPIYTIRNKVTSVAPDVYISSTPAPAFRETVFLKKSKSVSIVDKSKEEKIAEAVNEGLSLVKSAIKGYVKEAVAEETRNFDRYGSGGLRSRDETLQGSVDCKRTGLFRHPTQCNKFYACHWDCTKQRYTLAVFNCPVHLTFDSTQGACNWPSKGPSCTDNTLLPSS